MPRTCTIAALAGLVLILTPDLRARTPKTDTDREISIRVYNYAGLSDSVLERAQRETAHILRETGIETRWVACALKAVDLDKFPECNRRRAKADLVLAIVPREMAKKMDKRHDVFGVAASADSGKGYRASIFHHRIKELSERWQASEALLLGHFVAHEVGHLLLGTNSHSRSGIMHVPWTKVERERAHRASLLFTDQEAERIRADVERRARPEGRQ
ncbi:MAG: hypothetical protein GY953_38560 [bacterium]|nr:hypothetical protein [bacterium]